jgi:GNAT superfamily N-acetyltransferase
MLGRGMTIFREARAEDLPQVVALIRALAAFEKLPGPDEAAAERLAADFSARRFELRVAELPPPGGIIGYALYFMTYSTFLARPSMYLEDLFVDPAFRSRGIGAALLRDLAQLAAARGCGRFEWTVLEWNTRAQAFYGALGARLLPDWRVCRLDGDALAKLAKRG